MNQATIFLPCFALVIWTMFVMAIMFLSRVRAVKSGTVRMSYFRVLKGDIPDKLAAIARHFSNLFELPVLFYAVPIIVFVLQKVDTLYLILCWAFLVSRLVHGCIHITYNNVMHRLQAYFAGAFILLAVWIRVFIQIVTS